MNSIITLLYSQGNGRERLSYLPKFTQTVSKGGKIPLQTAWFDSTHLKSPYYLAANKTAPNSKYTPHNSTEPESATGHLKCRCAVLGLVLGLGLP